MKMVLGFMLIVAACAVHRVNARTLKQAAAPEFNYATLSDAISALDVANLTTLAAAIKVRYKLWS
jgi:hypothetical protein